MKTPQAERRAYVTLSDDQREVLLRWAEAEGLASFGLTDLVRIAALRCAERDLAVDATAPALPEGERA